MKKLILILVLISGFAYSQTDSIVQNHLIVKLRETYLNKNKIDLNKKCVGVNAVDKILKNSNLKSISTIGNYKDRTTLLLIFAESVDIIVIKRKLEAEKSIEFVEYDFIANGGGQKSTNSFQTPNDTYFFKQWGLVNNANLLGIGTQIANADVDMDLAWDIQTGDPNMIIAVIDSGLTLNNPDISSRIWTNNLEILGNGIDDDANGYIDDSVGWDWINNDNNPTDDHGHGTNCAGIIGAIPNNNFLYSGVNWNSKIMPLKALNSSNSGTYSAFVNAIYYAVDNGAKIVSMSIGGTSASIALSNAIAYANTKNVMLIFCMMNTNNNVSYYPARYSLVYPNVMAVGSTNPNDTRSAPFFWSTTSGSNFGTHINVVAPGNYIYGLNYNNNSDPNSFWGGTSQAAPLVAGIASLIFAQNPLLTPLQVRNVLQQTAKDQIGISTEDILGFDQYMGFGRVNAFNALQQTNLGIKQNDVSQQKFQLVNPVNKNELEFYFKEDLIENYEIEIFSIEGKKITALNKTINQGKNSIPFEFSSGKYIVVFKNANYSKTVKVVKN